MSAQDTSVPALLPALKSFALTLTVTALLLVAFTVGAYSFADPGAVTGTAALICLAVASFAGGIISSVIARQNAMLVSCMAGGMFVALLLILALAFDSINDPLLMMCGYAASFALHCLGTVAASKLSGGRKKRRRAY